MANQPYKGQNIKRSKLENWGLDAMKSGFSAYNNTPARIKRGRFINFFADIKHSAKINAGLAAYAIGRVGRRVGLLSRTEKNKRISEGLRRSSKVKNRKRKY